MARLYHPDVSPPDRVEEHARRFIMVKEAYEILSDPQRRDLYDRDLANGVGFNSSYQNGLGMEEKLEWKTRWQSQLEELKRRSRNPYRGKMSWRVRMRSQT
ncbi:chaperone protein Dnaj 20 chloroplastic [Phtheirospermum japonicum]|uniref:Chaperone protein Dnaj 20 chloroplastic n=1 Tax=Phtheirospermum japonicum TaxID=374723 RepID=A0A830CGQ3_9LAMI|nr:chaperone protein Dnaj 20 chloroplastic [Phtheirospermum japonicum]